jgi:hypothetical protein
MPILSVADISARQELPEGPHEEPGAYVILQEHSWCGS